MSIEIYTNESVPVGVASGLQRRGVAAISARDAGNLGLTDANQLEYAHANKMAIFTHDADFLRIAHEWVLKEREHSGIVYVHQERLSVGECIRRLKEIADVYSPADLRNHIEFL